LIEAAVGDDNLSLGVSQQNRYELGTLISLRNIEFVEIAPQDLKIFRSGLVFNRFS
jgi:hypothetical protein